MSDWKQKIECSNAHCEDGRIVIGFPEEQQFDCPDCTAGKLRTLLAKARCPDPDCDGEGTCAAMVPGYDGEGDIDVWECQWCAERKALLGEPEEC